jgi:hypothetical protein
MTLSTYLAATVTEDVARVAEELYQVNREMLGTPDAVEPIRGPEEYDGPGVRRIDHRPGIGLPAWLLMNYRAEGSKAIPFTPDSDWEYEGDELEEERRYHERDPWRNGTASIQVNWDTAYSYRGPHGESCSDLHALYIEHVGRWLDERGIDWHWKNEYTGEWHHGRDGLAEFSRFHRPGGDADNWFQGVMAAIRANGGVQV